MSMQVRLLGKPQIIDGNGRRQAVRGHQAWAIVARVLLSKCPLDRRILANELFPETHDPLGSLRWCLASIRRALNSAESFCGDPIVSNLPNDTDVDLWRLDDADYEIEGAGDLLQGIEPRCSPEFSTWLLIERVRISSQIEARIRRDTIHELSAGNHDHAIRLAEIGVRRAPLDEGSHILLVKSLTSAGHFDAAFDHVRATEKVFLAELGEKPSIALQSASRRTIAAPPPGVSPETIVDSLIESGLAALSAGAADAGIDCLRRAAAEAEKVKAGEPLARAMFELGAALVHSVRGFDDEGAIALRQSTELARQCGSASIASAGFRELGYVEALAGRRPGAAIYLKEAAELADDADNLAGIHAVTGFNLVDWGKVDEGLEHYDASLEFARSANNHRREIWSLGLGGWGLLAANRLADADRWLSSCLTLVEDQHWIAFRPWPIAVLAESRIRQDVDPGTVRPDLENAFALSCQLGDPCWESAVARVLALSYTADDDLPLAMEWLKVAQKHCVRETDIYTALLVEILANQMDTCVRLGDADKSRSFALELLSLAARAHMNTYVDRAAEIINTH